MWLDDVVCGLVSASTGFGIGCHFTDSVSHQAMTFCLRYMLETKIDLGSGKVCNKWQITRGAICKYIEAQRKMGAELLEPDGLL